MPDRGLLAPLSPQEEVTLRRLALGIAQPRELPTKDVARLKALVLIEDHGAGLRLTPTGKERYLTLPNSSAVFDTDAPDEALAKMAEFIRKSLAAPDSLQIGSNSTFGAERCQRCRKKVDLPLTTHRFLSRGLRAWAAADDASSSV